MAQVWHTARRRVVALAPSATAAAELSLAAGVDADTLAKLVHASGTEPEERWPRWLREIGPRSLVIIDEAGMAGTVDLVGAVDFVVGRGGSVRLVGDDHQLTSVSSGGVLRDLDHHVGAVRLTQVRRFTDPSEAAGAAGRGAVLPAPTRELVRELNQRARADRLAGLDPGPEVALADGSRAGVGDVVITRHNDRRLRHGASDWVRNGDRWTIADVSPDGGVVVRNHRRAGRCELPAAYVAEHVRLGYASTVHSAQGLTADTCHTVVTGTESRQLPYVAMSRGRDANHVSLAAAAGGDPHTVVDPETLAPSTAIEILDRMLHRDPAQRSATTAQRSLLDPAPRLHEAVLRYQDALEYAATQTLGTAWRTSLDPFAEHLVAGVTGCAAYSTLVSRLALGSASRRLRGQSRSY